MNEYRLCLRTGCWGEYLYLKSKKVRCVWRKLHNEELHNLCSLRKIMRAIEYRMRWVEYAARMCKVKSKVVPVLFFKLNTRPWRRIGEWMYNYTHSLTWWTWVVSFTPRPLYPREKAPGTHWIWGWVGPRAVLKAVVKRKNPSLRQKSNPRTPIVQSLAQRCTDWAITALARMLKMINIQKRSIWESEGKKPLGRPFVDGSTTG
jgi:hypothetical protein